MRDDLFGTTPPSDTDHFFVGLGGYCRSWQSASILTIVSMNVVVTSKGESRPNLLLPRKLVWNVQARTRQVREHNVGSDSAADASAMRITRVTRLHVGDSIVRDKRDEASTEERVFKAALETSHTR